jgi:dUTP pyrophosphatase
MSTHYYSDNVPSVEVVKLSATATIPTRAYTSDAGFDLYADEDIFLKLGETTVVSTGISLNIPGGYFGKIEDRSSLASLGIRSGGGVVDSGYTGEIKVVLHNLNNGSDSNYRGRGYSIKKGERIAQLIVQPSAVVRLVQSEKVEFSERAGNGFGSSGR